MAESDKDTLPVIARGERVTINYEIRLPDDRVVDSTFETEPFSFTVGDGSFDDKLEESLLGLPLGEQTRILLTPEYGFGQRSAELVHELPRSHFPADMLPVPDQVIEFTLPTGEPVAGTVVAANEETVTVDFNHPLAGHNIQLIVHVLEIDGALADPRVEPCA